MGTSAQQTAMSAAIDRIVREGGPLELATVAGMTSGELTTQLESWQRFRAVADGNIVQLLGEVMRREDFRSDGASSAADWQVDRFGLSTASARNYCRVAARAMDLPHLSGALSRGDISFDKVRAVVALATPETDQELAACAGERTAAELGELARSLRPRPEGLGKKGRLVGSARFNEECHTLSVQFPAEEFR